MTLIIDFAPEVETRLRAEAERRGQDAVEYVKTIVEDRLRDAATTPPVSLMALPLEERRRLISQGAEALEADYRDDLARPVEERELTAITALDNDPLFEEYPHAR